MYWFEFVTLAFPKSGMQVAGVPLTVSMFLFLYVVWKYHNQVMPALGQIKGLTAAYGIFVFSAFMALLFNLDKLSVFQLTSLMVVMGSPLAIAVGRAVEPKRAYEILAISVVIVGGYAMSQWFFGILSTSMPGLTYTFGQDLTTKPIGYGAAQGAEAQKMPSTYQNGNGAGLFYAMAIPIMLAWLPEAGRQKGLKIAAILLGTAGLALSGSRAILIPFGFLFAYLLIQYVKKMKYKNQVLFLALAFFTAIAGMVYMFTANSEFLQQAYGRYIVQTLSDPTGSSRTIQYEAAFTQVYGMAVPEFLRFLAIGVPWNLEVWTEGISYLLFTVGAVGFLGFVLMMACTLLGIYQRNKLWAIGFMCVVVAFTIDSSFLFPPSLMNFFLLAGMLTQPDAKSATLALGKKPHVPDRNPEQAAG